MGFQPSRVQRRPHIAFGRVNQGNRLYESLLDFKVKLHQNKRSHSEDVSAGHWRRTERSTHVKCIELSGSHYITIWSWECV